MSKILIEEAVDDLYDYLYANLSTKLDSLDTQYGDGITLEDIPSNGWYIGDLVNDITQMILPSLTIIARKMKPDQVRKDNITARSYIQVVIAVGEPENNATVRFRRLARYARAVFELIHAWQLPAGGGAYEVLWEENFEYTSVLPVDPYIQAVGIPVTLIRKETI